MLIDSLFVILSFFSILFLLMGTLFSVIKIAGLFTNIEKNKPRFTGINFISISH